MAPDSENLIREKISAFKNLSQDEADILLNGLKTLTYKKGELIFKPGDKPLGLLCLSKGKVKIYKEGIGGREQIIRMARSDGFIGYRSLFADELYSATAETIEDSEVYLIDKNCVFKVLRGNAELTLNIMKKMATELGISNTRTVSLTQKHIRGRLAESLLFLKDTYGFTEDSTTINIYLSREDIANLSNMTTSNAIRTLSTFASEGVIAIDGRKIKILELNKLERISELG